MDKFTKLHNKLEWKTLLKRAEKATGLEFSYNCGTGHIDVKYKDMWFYINNGSKGFVKEWDRIRKQQFIDNLEDLKYKINTNNFGIPAPTR